MRNEIGFIITILTSAWLTWNLSHYLGKLRKLLLKERLYLWIP